MAALYFDDLNKGSSQLFCGRLAALLGSPFPHDKQQRMKSEGEFLGLWHDVGSAVHRGGTHFWVKEKLLAKVNSYIQGSRYGGVMTPGTAPKLYGCLSHGKTGRSGLLAIQERQHSVRGIVNITPDLDQALEFVSNFLQLLSQRLLCLQPSTFSRFLVASEAAQDVPKKGSAGARVAGLHACRIGPRGQLRAFLCLGRPGGENFPARAVHCFDVSGGVRIADPRASRAVVREQHRSPHVARQGKERRAGERHYVWSRTVGPGGPLLQRLLGMGCQLGQLVGWRLSEWLSRFVVPSTWIPTNQHEAAYASFQTAHCHFGPCGFIPLSALDGVHWETFEHGY